MDTGIIFGDQTVDGETLVVAFGGIGGLGNAHYLSNRNRAPEKFTEGKDGEEWLLNLELKLLAEVGIIGLPNAGKSTLISVLSAARPKIADYPFTTLITNFCVLSLGSYGYTLEGLIICYTLALPFFGYTIITTIIFSAIIEFFIQRKFIQKISLIFFFSAKYIIFCIFSSFYSCLITNYLLLESSFLFYSACKFMIILGSAE